MVLIPGPVWPQFQVGSISLVESIFFRGILSLAVFSAFTYVLDPIISRFISRINLIKGSNFKKMYWCLNIWELQRIPRMKTVKDKVVTVIIWKFKNTGNVKILETKTVRDKVVTVLIWNFFFLIMKNRIYMLKSMLVVLYQ